MIFKAKKSATFQRDSVKVVFDDEYYETADEKEIVMLQFFGVAIVESMPKKKKAAKKKKVEADANSDIDGSEDTSADN